MRTPEQTSVAMEIQNAVNSEDEDQILRDCPLFPQSPDDMQYLLDFAQFHKSNFIPNQVRLFMKVMCPCRKIKYEEFWITHK